MVGMLKAAFWAKESGASVIQARVAAILGDVSQIGRAVTSLRVWLTALSCTLAVAVAVTPAHAQRDSDEEEDDEGINRTISERVAEHLQAAIAASEIEPPDHPLVLSHLNEGLAVRNITPYELGVLLQISGNTKFQMENTPGAIADWERALAEGEMLTKERLTLKYNVGLLYMTQEDFATAARIIEEWLVEGGVGTAPIHLNMVYAYSELGQLRDSLRHAQRAYEVSERPVDRKIYDTLNFLYSELNMPRQRLEIVSEMASVFPDDKDVWITLSVLYGQRGQERKSFEVYRSMYTNGMLTTEEEILRLAETYSYYEAPYHGARILEREMNAGRVARNYDNYDALARYYQQAREFERSLTPLRQAAQLAATGEDFKDLGQSLYRLGRYEDAEIALRDAIEKGGMPNPGKAHELLGAAFYERDESEETLLETIERFEEARLWYEKAAELYLEDERLSSHRTAVEWTGFIDATIEDRMSRARAEADAAYATIRIACATLDPTLVKTVLDAGGSLADLNPRLDGINCIDLLADEEGYRVGWEQTRRADLAALDSAAAGEANDG